MSKNKLIIGAHCEICKYEYKMSYEFEKVCIPKVGCKIHKGNGSILACLFVVFACLLSL